MISKSESAREALTRAQGGESFANYPAIISGFMEKGIHEGEILPRENVFTFQAWRALGRTVRKGEHGVRVQTYIPCTRETESAETGKVEIVTWTRPKVTTVFHVSQTEEWRPERA